MFDNLDGMYSTNTAIVTDDGRDFKYSDLEQFSYKIAQIILNKFGFTYDILNLDFKIE